MIVKGTITGITEIDVGATLKIEFYMMDSDDIKPADFRFFSADSQLLTETADGIDYPNPNTLEVDQISTDGSSITLKYNAKTTTAFQFQIKISKFNTPYFPDQEPISNIIFTSADNDKNRDTEVTEDKNVKFTVRDTNLYPIPEATIINPGGASDGYVGESSEDNKIQIRIPKSTFLEDIPYGVLTEGRFEIISPKLIDTLDYNRRRYTL